MSAERPGIHSIRISAALLAVIGIAFGAVACGSSAHTPATADLHVTLRPDGTSGPSQTWTVTCPSSAHESACTTLAASKDAFTPYPANSACTMIYGGPETLTVTGTVGTRTIDYTTGRANGCEIADYARDLALVAPFRPAS